ncbi:MAG: glucose 1-dehydrogenase [Fimbriimonadaceae bacterium]|nr:glucose 1-dehydrogenase [Fimbriimonadaceae bacterium]
MAERVVLITGGARGIGYGIAECFARQGERVALADLNPAAAAQSAAALLPLGAPDAAGFAVDVAHRASVEALLAAVSERLGAVDVLVNNAGICPFEEVMAMTPETWQRTLDINLTGAFHCTQVVGQQMIDRGQGGRVICITSLAENVTSSAQVDYGASKAGLRMTTVGFSIALGRHGITCNAIAPGMILTDLTRWHWEQPEHAAFIKQRVPVGRIGTPTDIGHAAVFLASPEAAYINGITLRVDGGHQACCV